MPLTRILLIVLGFALGVIGSYQALVSFRAEIASLTGNRASAQGAAVAAQQAALRALSLRPRDYRYLEQAALAEEQLQRPQHARQFWREAIEQRPGWPYAWARLSRWQLLHGRDDVASDRALRSSARWGDNERGLWKFFALLALDLPDHVAIPPVRRFLDERLEREIRTQPTHLMGYALMRRRETALCRVWSRTAPENYWCGAARYARPICDSRHPLPSKTS
ncbi:MAG: tetratricopeptide repeat protein, partial [Panacagrimonas sp.]